MRRVNISTLKNNLSAILATLDTKGPLIVTDRDRPVAELRRVESPKVEDEARYASLVRRGLLIPPREPGSVLDALKIPRPKLKKPAGALEALLAERREGR